MPRSALIIGAGPGLGASLAAACVQADYAVAVASRHAGQTRTVCDEVGAEHITCDVADAQSVSELFARMDSTLGAPDLVVYNAGFYTRAPIADLDLEDVGTALSINALGACTVAQEAARRMIPKGRGTMLFTGASAGVKGFAESAPFAMGKFALRGLCQSLSRELAPKSIHVAHFVLDGMIYQPDRGGLYADRGSTLHPDEIARTYLDIARQHNSCWTYEIELRPNVERF